MARIEIIKKYLSAGFKPSFKVLYLSEGIKKQIYFGTKVSIGEASPDSNGNPFCVFSLKAQKDWNE